MKIMLALKALYWAVATACLILVAFTVIFQGILPKQETEVFTYEEDGYECAVYESGKSICKELSIRT